MNILQRVRIWIENVFNALCFELFFSSCQILNICLQCKYHVLVLFISWKRHLLHFSCCFKAHNFELKLLLRVRIRFEKKSNSSESKIRKTQRVLFLSFKRKTRQFRVKIFSTCQFLYQLLYTLQFLNWKFYNASDFKSIFWTCVNFWIEYFTTRQNLDWKSFQRVMFWINFFVMSDFEHMFAMQISRFGSFHFVKTPFVAFFVLF